LIGSRVKTGLIIALGVVGSYMYFFMGDPAPNPNWTSSKAKQFVVSSMEDFCKALYGDGVCPNTRLGGKQRWIITSDLTTSGIRTQQVDDILVPSGWARIDLDNESIAGFCKQGYFARYDHANGYVNTISFQGGSRGCEKLLHSPK